MCGIWYSKLAAALMLVCSSDSYVMAAWNPAYCGILAGVVLDLFCVLDPALFRNALPTASCRFTHRRGAGPVLRAQPRTQAAPAGHLLLAQAVAGLLLEQRRWTIVPRLLS